VEPDGDTDRDPGDRSEVRYERVERVDDRADIVHDVKIARARRKAIPECARPMPDKGRSLKRRLSPSPGRSVVRPRSYALRRVTTVLPVLALLAVVAAVLVAAERGLFKGRTIVPLAVVVSVAAALLARAIGAGGFVVASALLLPFLGGLVAQEVNATFAVLASSRRRRRRRRRPRPKPDWWVPAEAEDEDQIAA
jgi:hypothetical protein